MRVTIMLLTYNRYEYAEKTLRCTLDRIHFSGELGVHIADDGSPDNYVDRLRYFAGCYSNVVSISHSITPRKGYGANYNAATHIIHGTSDYVLPLEDDWELQRPLDLDLLVGDLESTTDFGCIRMGYIGWTAELNATFVKLGSDQRHYLHLLPTSKELHVFSGHPRLEKVSWERNVGLWPENMAPGDTEIVVSGRKSARTGVIWPLWNRPDIYEHIGTLHSEWPGRN